MKTKLIITVFALVLFASGTALADLPCTHMGQESLQAAAACVKRARVAKYLNAHHEMMVNKLVNQELIPPHPYPAGTYADPLPYIYFASAAYGGYRNTQYMWPASWYIYHGFWPY